MADASRIVFFHVTQGGRSLAQSLAPHYPGAACLRLSRREVEGRWKKGWSLVFIMASGIAVRTIAPFLKGKRTDPAVVVLDEGANHAISLLGGHAAGANALAGEIAQLVGGRAVITTATDTAGLPGLDLWAEAQGLVIEDWGHLPRAGAKLLAERRLRVFSDVPLALPEAYSRTDDPFSADVLVTNRTDAAPVSFEGVILRPRNLVIGIGCNSATPEPEIARAVAATFQDHCLSLLSARVVATIDRKADEPGLAAFAQNRGLPLVSFSAEKINLVPGVTPSDAARRAIGAKAVAEPAALLAAPGSTLLVPKEKWGNVTVAVAEDPIREAGEEAKRGRGKRGAIFVVGTGPGSADHVTPRALDALRKADVIVGYGPYLDLIDVLIQGKPREASAMTREIERAARAVDLAEAGRTVAVVSGGDPGIYAMAGLVLDLASKARPKGEDSGIPVEVIPGVSALNACAARLGAPLMHDFAAISLSDRLTPWDAIEGRLLAAAAADFVIALYNPRSKGRPHHLKRACRLIMRHRAAHTPVGIVKGATRRGEAVIVIDLGHVPYHEIDMHTLVIVGNSKTFVREGVMITPRGYEEKEG